MSKTGPGQYNQIIHELWYIAGKTIINCLVIQFKTVSFGGAQIVMILRSKTEKLTPVASLVNIHHIRARTGLIGPVTV